MPFLETGCVTLHVQRLAAAATVAPAGTVVLVHGLLVDSLASYYLLLAPALRTAGFDVLLYDQRGHGRSSRPDRGYRLDEFADDLRAVLDDQGLTGPVHLVGNSFGGAVLFDFAHHFPHRVASLALIESEPPTPGWAFRMDRFLRYARAEIERDATLQGIAHRYGAQAARLARTARTFFEDTALAEEIPLSRVLTASDLRALHCPVLALYGSESDLAKGQRQVAETLRECRSVIVPDQGHSLLVEAPATVLRYLLPWLRENAHRGSLAGDEGHGDRGGAR
ncbi:alpha/beta fold hydrolase [Streptomyces sp. HUAS TT7]|uniref:alpha/beta fold hydrolase n=1 Tax=Streptomyces sp. HUAS TT7 TaxID=3447507 RepID=UPI003F65CDAB